MVNYTIFAKHYFMTPKVLVVKFCQFHLQFQMFIVKFYEFHLQFHILMKYFHTLHHAVTTVNKLMVICNIPCSNLFLSHFWE